MRGGADDVRRVGGVGWPGGEPRWWAGPRGSRIETAMAEHMTAPRRGCV
jgi:hypothetical protein